MGSLLRAGANLPLNGHSGSTNMLLRDLLDLGLSQCGDIRRLGGDNSLRRFRIMGL